MRIDASPLPRAHMLSATTRQHTGNTISFMLSAELLRRVSDYYHGLSNNWEVKPGDRRVRPSSPPTARVARRRFRHQRSGGVTVPVLFPRITPERIQPHKSSRHLRAHVLLRGRRRTTSKASLGVCHDADLPQLEHVQLSPMAVRHPTECLRYEPPLIASAAGLRESRRPLTVCLAAQSCFPPVYAASSTPPGISTGEPKGVMLTHNQHIHPM